MSGNCPGEGGVGGGVGEGGVGGLGPGGGVGPGDGVGFGDGTIETLAKAAHDQDLGGIMVWYASVIDSATGKPGNQYSGGAMDASIQSATTQAEWKRAVDIMHGRSVDTVIV